MDTYALICIFIHVENGAPQSDSRCARPGSGGKPRFAPTAAGAERHRGGFRWRSLMVAALFALHPMNVESVAWAAERKNLLSMLFFLFALYAYVWYTRRPGLRRY